MAMKKSKDKDISFHYTSKLTDLINRCTIDFEAIGK